MVQRLARCPFKAEMRVRFPPGLPEFALITMMQFNPDWRFDPPSPIPQNVREQFFEMIGRCGTRERRHEILEHFKVYFAAAAGTTSYGSSSASWAETDLRSYMSEAGINAPLFIEAFYDGCQALPADLARPRVERINRILQDTNSGWQIQLPNLVRTDSLAAPIPVEEERANLDAQARELIQNALSRSERFLADGETLISSFGNSLVARNRDNSIPRNGCRKRNH